VFISSFEGKGSARVLAETRCKIFSSASINSYFISYFIGKS
jgi:hypothetical protein